MGDITFYEGNGACQDIVCTLNDTAGQRVNCKDHDDCENDEARSCLLRNVRANAVIRVYDSPSGDKDDDWTEITVLRTHPEYTVRTFEKNLEDVYLRIVHHHNNGLDGKVSRIEID